MTLTSRRTLRPWGYVLVALVGVVVASLVVWIGYSLATDPARYRGVLDQLKFPAAWTIPHPDVENRALLYGSRMTRFYLVDADPAETATVVERVVTDAGFTLDHGYGDLCHRNPSNGPIDTCTVAASRGEDHLWIVVHARGTLVSYSVHGDGPAAGGPNLSVVRVQAGPGY